MRRVCGVRFFGAATLFCGGENLILHLLSQRVANLPLLPDQFLFACGLAGQPALPRCWPVQAAGYVGRANVG